MHRSLPGIRQVVHLRRMIGIDPHPFAAIPERLKHHFRFHRIAARIRTEEAKLVEHLGGINQDLERRAGPPFRKYDLGTLRRHSGVHDFDNGTIK